MLQKSATSRWQFLLLVTLSSYVTVCPTPLADAILTTSQSKIIRGRSPNPFLSASKKPAVEDRSDSYEEDEYPQYPEDGPYWGDPYAAVNNLLGDPYHHQPYMGPLNGYEQHHYRPATGNDFLVESPHYGAAEQPVAYHYYSAPVVSHRKFMYPKYYNFDYIHSH